MKHRNGGGLLTFSASEVDWGLALFSRPIRENTDIRHKHNAVSDSTFERKSMSDEPRNTSRIILALDVDNTHAAREILTEVREQILWAKLGLELINAQKAHEVASMAHQLGYKVFWDGKLKDIPRTIGAATKAAEKHGVKMINVHASSGVEGMMAAVANKGDALILAVSVLTSHDTENTEIDFGSSRKAKVLEFARMAAYSGCDGLICSPKELDFLARYYQRKDFPEAQLGKLIKVIPGTRSPGADHQDQRNVETQEIAIQNGADWLVIGSEIMKKPQGSKVLAAKALNERIAQALADKAKGVE